LTATVTINPDSTIDLAAAINAALADPTVTTVVLGAGEFLLHSSVIVPSGKTLIGAGRDATILRAAADFEIIDSSNNSVVISEQNAVDIVLSDFAVDAAKLSPEGLRLNGVFMKFATDFSIARVDVSNATGYAHFAQGDLNAYFAGGDYVQASGTYEDCQTFNSQVHFEQMFANGVTLTNVHARDGDGDISTEAYFHPLVGSSDITYIDSSAKGSGFLGFSLISSSLPLADITIINTTVEIESPSVGSALIALGNLPIDGLTIANSSFIAHNYIAVRLGGVTGTASGSYFQGGLIALEVTTSGNGTASDFEIADSIALGLRDPASGAAVAGIHADNSSYLTWSGGTIEARGRLGSPISGQVTLVGNPELVSGNHDVISTYVEDSEAIAVFAGASWTATGATSVAGAELQIDFLAFGSETDLLTVVQGGSLALSNGALTIAGRSIGTVTGGVAGSDLIIAFSTGATVADAQVVLQAVRYRETANEPDDTAARLIQATLSFANGTSDTISASAAITLVNDLTQLNLGNAAVAGLTYVEGAAATILAPAAELNDPDTSDLAGSTLLVSITSGLQSGDRIEVIAGSNAPLGVIRAGQSLFFNGVAFGVVTNDNIGGVLRINLSTNATQAAVEALVRAIGFRHTGDAPSDAARTIAFRLQNSAGDFEAVAPLTLRITAVDDAAVAVADSATTAENAAVSISPLANDIDADGRLDVISQVGGQAISFGGTVTLASGALVTLLATGQLRYDPAGAFGYLAGSESGTALTRVLDSFSYTLSGGSSNSIVVTVNGVTSAQDILQGDGGANSLTARLSGQTLVGLGGNDTLNDGSVAAVLAGGAGDDRYHVSQAGTTITEDAGAGSDQVETTLARYSLGETVEQLRFTGSAAVQFFGFGNALANTLEGGRGNDFLYGYAGDDRLFGGLGGDVLDGGTGHDLLDGGADSDVMTGREGNDIYIVDSANDMVVERADGGSDTINVTLADFVLPEEVENLSFSGQGNFTGTGNERNNEILGSGWSDVLSGLDGNDRLAGFAGDDMLDGGAGDDWLFPGYGSDFLTGGTGADHFRFDLPTIPGNLSTIADFESGLDLIELSRTVFTAIDIGTLAADAYAIGPESVSTATRIVHDPASGKLYYDPDGTGAAAMVHFANVTPGLVLQASDFFGL